MKKFLYRLLLFITPILIVWVGMDIYMRNLQSSYKMKISALESNKDSVEIIILGNSHATYGVDPRSFDKFALNLANANQSLYFDRRIIAQNLKNLPKLKFVFISIDFHTLNFSDQGIRNTWSYYATGIKYKNESYFLHDVSPFAFGYKPNFAFKILIKNFLRSKINGTFYFDLDGKEHGDFDLKKGFISYKGQNKSEWNLESFKNRAIHFQSSTDSLEKFKVIEDLKGFVKELKSNKVTPIFFSCPTYEEYNSYFDPKTKKEYIEEVEELARHLGVDFLQYAFGNNFNSDEFYNGDHLNEIGAKHFGDILNQYIQKLENN